MKNNEEKDSVVSWWALGVAIEREIGYQMHQQNIDKQESEDE